MTAGLPVILQDSEGNTYVYGLDLISRTDDQGDQEYYLYDGLGSTTDLTDENGDVIASYTYDVFGAIRSQSGSSDNYWLFTGEQSDSDEGLYYLRARYYDPASGRFLSQDPVPAINAYPYVGDNPVNYVDPAGLCHERLGWDQMCGVWAHKKEGQGFEGETAEAGNYNLVFDLLGTLFPFIQHIPPQAIAALTPGPDCVATPKLVIDGATIFAVGVVWCDHITPAINITLVPRDLTGPPPPELDYVDVPCRGTNYCRASWSRTLASGQYEIYFRFEIPQSIPPVAETTVPFTIR